MCIRFSRILSVKIMRMGPGLLVRFRAERVELLTDTRNYTVEVIPQGRRLAATGRAWIAWHVCFR